MVAMRVAILVALLPALVVAYPQRFPEDETRGSSRGKQRYVPEDLPVSASAAEADWNPGKTGYSRRRSGSTQFSGIEPEVASSVDFPVTQQFLSSRSSSQRRSSYNYQTPEDNSRQRSGSSRRISDTQNAAVERFGNSRRRSDSVISASESVDRTFVEHQVAFESPRQNYHVSPAESVRTTVVSDPAPPPPSQATATLPVSRRRTSSRNSDASSIEPSSRTFSEAVPDRQTRFESSRRRQQSPEVPQDANAQDSRRGGRRSSSRGSVRSHPDDAVNSVSSSEFPSRSRSSGRRDSSRSSRGGERSVANVQSSPSTALPRGRSAPNVQPNSIPENTNNDIPVQETVEDTSKIATSRMDVGVETAEGNKAPENAEDTSKEPESSASILPEENIPPSSEASSTSEPENTPKTVETPPSNRRKSSSRSQTGPRENSHERAPLSRSSDGDISRTNSRNGSQRNSRYNANGHIDDSSDSNAVHANDQYNTRTQGGSRRYLPTRGRSNEVETSARQSSDVPSLAPPRGTPRRNVDKVRSNNEEAVDIGSLPTVSSRGGGRRTERRGGNRATAAAVEAPLEETASSRRGSRLRSSVPRGDSAPTESSRTVPRSGRRTAEPDVASTAQRTSRRTSPDAGQRGSVKGSSSSWTVAKPHKESSEEDISESDNYPAGFLKALKQLTSKKPQQSPSFRARGSADDAFLTTSSHKVVTVTAFAPQAGSTEDDAQRTSTNSLEGAGRRRPGGKSSSTSAEENVPTDLEDKARKVNLLLAPSPPSESGERPSRGPSNDVVSPLDRGSKFKGGYVRTSKTSESTSNADSVATSGRTAQRQTVEQASARPRAPFKSWNRAVQAEAVQSSTPGVSQQLPGPTSSSTLRTSSRLGSNFKNRFSLTSTTTSENVVTASGSSFESTRGQDSSEERRQVPTPGGRKGVTPEGIDTSTTRSGFIPRSRLSPSKSFTLPETSGRYTYSSKTRVATEKAPSAGRSTVGYRRSVTATTPSLLETTPLAPGPNPHRFSARYRNDLLRVTGALRLTTTPAYMPTVPTISTTTSTTSSPDAPYVENSSEALTLDASRRSLTLDTGSLTLTDGVSEGDLSLEALGDAQQSLEALIDLVPSSTEIEPVFVPSPLNEDKSDLHLAAFLASRNMTKLPTPTSTDSSYTTTTTTSAPTTVVTTTAAPTTTITSTELTSTLPTTTSTAKTTTTTITSTPHTTTTTPSTTTIFASTTSKLTKTTKPTIITTINTTTTTTTASPPTTPTTTPTVKATIKPTTSTKITTTTKTPTTRPTTTSTSTTTRIPSTTNYTTVSMTEYTTVSTTKYTESSDILNREQNITTTVKSPPPLATSTVPVTTTPIPIGRFATRITVAPRGTASSTSFPLPQPRLFSQDRIFDEFSNFIPALPQVRNLHDSPQSGFAQARNFDISSNSIPFQSLQESYQTTPNIYTYNPPSTRRTPVPYVIFGIFPNNTVFRKFPNSDVKEIVSENEIARNAPYYPDEHRSTLSQSQLGVTSRNEAASVYSARDAAENEVVLRAQGRETVLAPAHSSIGASQVLGVLIIARQEKEPSLNQTTAPVSNSLEPPVVPVHHPGQQSVPAPIELSNSVYSGQDNKYSNYWSSTTTRKPQFRLLTTDIPATTPAVVTTSPPFIVTPESTLTTSTTTEVFRWKPITNPSVVEDLAASTTSTISTTTTTPYPTTKITTVTPTTPTTTTSKPATTTKTTTTTTKAPTTTKTTKAPTTTQKTTTKAPTTTQRATTKASTTTQKTTKAPTTTHGPNTPTTTKTTSNTTQRTTNAPTTTKLPTTTKSTTVSTTTKIPTTTKVTTTTNKPYLISPAPTQAPAFGLRSLISRVLGSIAVTPTVPTTEKLVTPITTTTEKTTPKPNVTTKPPTPKTTTSTTKKPVTTKKPAPPTTKKPITTTTTKKPTTIKPTSTTTTTTTTKKPTTVATTVTSTTPKPVTTTQKLAAGVEVSRPSAGLAASNFDDTLLLNSLAQQEDKGKPGRERAREIANKVIEIALQKSVSTSTTTSHPTLSMKNFPGMEEQQEAKTRPSREKGPDSLANKVIEVAMQRSVTSTTTTQSSTLATLQGTPASKDLLSSSSDAAGSSLFDRPAVQSGKPASSSLASLSPDEQLLAALLRSQLAAPPKSPSRPKPNALTPDEQLLTALLSGQFGATPELKSKPQTTTPAILSQDQQLLATIVGGQPGVYPPVKPKSQSIASTKPNQDQLLLAALLGGQLGASSTAKPQRPGKSRQVSDEEFLAALLAAVPPAGASQSKGRAVKTTSQTQPPPTPGLGLFGRLGGGGGAFSDPASIQLDDDEDPPRGQRLVKAAIDVTKAVSQFMNVVIQGATQQFQSFFRSGTNLLGNYFSLGSARGLSS